jgi:hypothetical protein
MTQNKLSKKSKPAKPMNIFKSIIQMPRKIQRFFDDVLSLIKANLR